MKKVLFSAAIIAITLTACGGGDDENAPGDSTGPGSGAPTTPIVTPGIPVTYAVGSFEAMALDYVNRTITNCGYASMTAASDLSVAAKNHANYVGLDGFRIAHDETPGKPGFTGATPYDRMKAAGASDERAWAAGEGVGGFGNINGRVATDLLAAPYHQAGSLNQWTEIGVGTTTSTDGSTVLVLNYGGSRLNTIPAHGVRTFPCQGTVDLGGRGGPETPDPFPGLNGDFGPSLNFETNKGGKITVDSISLRNETTGQMVSLMAVPQAPGFAAEPWRAMYASRGYLTDNTSYRVEARGKTFATTSGNDSPVAWERNYSFKTF